MAFPLFFARLFVSLPSITVSYEVLGCQSTMRNDIIIVGNGFDVNHGLPSSYSNYKTWLRSYDKKLYDFLERYIDVKGDWWKDFERSLSEINVPRLIRETPPDHSPSIPGIPPSFYEPACGLLDSIRDKIATSFTVWINSMKGASPRKCVDLQGANLYISFNYTDTLEQVYGIKGNRILYIHGKASRGDKLIFGHGKNQFLLENDVRKKYGLYESEDFLKAGTYGDSEFQLTHHLAYWEKNPYKQLVKYSEVLLPAVRSSETVLVYGLSFSEVDYPYIQWLVMHNSNLHWRVSWHTDEDKTRISDTFLALNVSDYEFVYL